MQITPPDPPVPPSPPFPPDPPSYSSPIIVGTDSETALIQRGLLAPPLVCVAHAVRGPTGIVVDLQHRNEGIASYHRHLSDPGVILAIHNGPFDLGVACAEDVSLVPLVFDAYERGGIYCSITTQKLIDIALGMRKFRRASNLYTLSSGVVVKSTYSLEDLILLYYGERVQKADTWRLSYGLLHDIPIERWPESARKYATWDAALHLRVWEGQRRKIVETWGELPNQKEQQQSAFALYLMAMWGVRAERAAVDRFIENCRREIDKMHVDLANTGIFKAAWKCAGKCTHTSDEQWGVCPQCGRSLCRRNPDVGKRTMAEIRRRVVEACARLQMKVPMTEPSEKYPMGQVSTDKDTLELTDDPDLHVLATQMTFEKHLGQWGPVCEAAVERPVCSKYDIAETGRTTCSGSQGQEGTNFQNPPRKGDVRPCFIPREGWVFCSTDADTIELRAHAQNCLEMVGWSKMAEALWDQHRNKGPDLHLRLAAQIMGIDPYEALARKNAGDKEVGEARQFAKCFHPDTEILTRRRGWVKISEVRMEDEVASAVPQEHRQPVVRERDKNGRFPKTGRHDWRNEPMPSIEIVWAKPERLTKRKATEGLIHLQNESIDLRVTPDHRMLTYTGTKALQVVAAKDFGHQRGWFNAGTFEGGEKEVDERLLRLAVATQADGNYLVKGVEQPKIRFGFTKKRKVERLEALLRPSEYVRSTVRNGKYGTKESFILSEELSDQIKELLDCDKTLPWWWLELTPKLRNLILEEVSHWDSWEVRIEGSRRSAYYYTVIEKNAEVMQSIAAITGRKATFLPKKEYVFTDEEGFVQERTLYSLSIKKKNDSRGESVQRTKVEYDDYVYCLTVPSEHVLVRDGMKRIPVITLNCPNFGFPGGLGPETMITYAAAQLDKASHRRWFGDTRDEQFKRAKRLREIWFETWPENRPYFKLVGDKVPMGSSEGTIQQLRSNRIRGGARFTAIANGFFQGRVIDGERAVLWQLGQECYTGRCYSKHVHGGSNLCTHEGRSILYGSRPVLFLHDEPILEHPYDGSESDRAERQQQIVVENLSEWMDKVPITSSAVLMFRWSKGAEPLKVNGKHVPVKPETFVGADGRKKVKWVQDFGEARMAA